MNTYDPSDGVVYRHMTRETDTYAIPGAHEAQSRPAALRERHSLAADPSDGPSGRPGPTESASVCHTCQVAIARIPLTSTG